MRQSRSVSFRASTLAVQGILLLNTVRCLCCKDTTSSRLSLTTSATATPETTSCRACKAGPPQIRAVRGRLTCSSANKHKSLCCTPLCTDTLFVFAGDAARSIHGLNAGQTRLSSKMTCDTTPGMVEPWDQARHFHGWLACDRLW